MTTTGSTTSCSSNRRMARGSASNTLVSSTYVRTAELDPRLPVEAATSATLRPKGVLKVYDTPDPVGAGAARELSAAEAAFAGGVGADRPQEVDPAEVRPQRLAEVELAVDALPEQEAAEPLLPGGTNHEVRVGLSLRVQMIRDVLHVEQFGELLDTGPLGRMLLQQRAYGVGQLVPAAVAHGDVDRHAVDVASGVGRRLEPCDRGG